MIADTSSNTSIRIYATLRYATLRYASKPPFFNLVLVIVPGYSELARVSSLYLGCLASLMRRDIQGIGKILKTLAWFGVPIGILY